VPLIQKRRGVFLKRIHVEAKRNVTLCIIIIEAGQEEFGPDTFDTTVLKTVASKPWCTMDRNSHKEIIFEVYSEGYPPVS